MRAFALAVTLLIVAQAASAQTVGWLDKPFTAWNHAHAQVPKAPAPKGDAPSDPRCPSAVRQPATAGERAVTEAGWSLYGPVRHKGDTTVLLAQASVDGMCRPWDYQAFVFVKGAFAGTLSPVLMDSRTDGALSDVRLLSPTSIEATFLRYADADPLCCPSRVSTVRYRVDRRPEGPAAVALSVYTK